MRSDALLKSYSELEKQRAKFAEDARAEVEKSLFGKRPEKPDAYEIAAKGTPDNVVVLDAPPGADFVAEPGKAYVVLDKSDPVFGLARDLAHKAGLSQEDFAGLVGKYAASQAVAPPTPEQVRAQKDAFYSQLGENGRARVSHTWQQLQSVVGAKGAAALDSLVADPASYEALEALVAKAGGATFAPSNVATAGATTEADIRAIMREKDYYSDPAKQARVQEFYTRQYGGKPITGRG